MRKIHPGYAPVGRAKNEGSLSLADRASKYKACVQTAVIVFDGQFLVL